jgi:mannose-6-phosphate isomerase-like protein (cupin superfamily)
MHSDQTRFHLQGVRRAVVCMPCATLEPTLSFFTEQLGFRVDAIFPAEDPRTAFISGYGVTLRLKVGDSGEPAPLTLLCDDPAAVAGGLRDVVAPNGARIRLSPADPPMHSPPTVAERVLTRTTRGDVWTHGRAGLRYRDLLPKRHGGAFIASHIRVLEGGPVKDYVHYHKARFQMIFCREGWLRVAYEGQTEVLLMQEGDCFLQPPEIRHRVLEASAGAEVVEIASPAEHVTMADHETILPSPSPLRADHDFNGQRFVHHIASRATWRPWRLDGFEYADTGIAAATDGLAGVRVARRTHAPVPTRTVWHDTEFCFYFVLSGRLTIVLDGASAALSQDDSITLPSNDRYAFTEPSDDLRLLEVTLPASFELHAA